MREQMIFRNTLAVVTLLSSLFFTVSAQNNSNFQSYLNCDSPSTVLLDLKNIIDGKVFDSTSVYEVFEYNLSKNLYHRGLKDKSDTVMALISCLTNLNCQVNVDSNRLKLYNSTLDELEILNQSTTSLQIDSLLLNSTEELSLFEKFTILESEVIFFGEVIALQYDLPGAREFHSEYMIRIDSLIYASSKIVSGDTVLLKKVTGVDNAIGQNQEGALKIWMLQDERLTLGQRKLFFLSNYSYLSRALRSHILLNQNDEVCLGYYFDQLTYVRYPDLLEMKVKFIIEFVKQYQ